MLKNSVFGQSGAYQRNTVPLVRHSENVVCQWRAHKTLVLISDSVFSACEFFNRISPMQTLSSASFQGYNNTTTSLADYFRGGAFRGATVVDLR